MMLLPNYIPINLDCFKALTPLEITIIGLCYNVYQLIIIAVFFIICTAIFFLRLGILDNWGYIIHRESKYEVVYGHDAPKI